MPNPEKLKFEKIIKKTISPQLFPFFFYDRVHSEAVELKFIKLYYSYHLIVLQANILYRPNYTKKVSEQK